MAPRKRAADDGILVPKYEAADIGAIKALAEGKASPVQQQRALAWIINEACRYYDLSFKPGPDGERATTFAEGRRFVGAEIVRMTKIIITPQANKP